MNIEIRLSKEPANIPVLLLTLLLQKGSVDFLDLVLLAPMLLGRNARALRNLSSYLAAHDKPYALVKMFHHAIVSGLAVKVLQNPSMWLGWPKILVRPTFDVERSTLPLGKDVKVWISWAQRPESAGQRALVGTFMLRTAPEVDIISSQTKSAALLASGVALDRDQLLAALREDPTNVGLIVALARLGETALFASLKDVDRHFVVQQLAWLQCALILARANLDSFNLSVRAWFGARTGLRYGAVGVEAQLRKFYGPANYALVVDRLAQWEKWEKTLGAVLPPVAPPKAFFVGWRDPLNCKSALVDPAAQRILVSVVRTTLFILRRRAGLHRITPAEISARFFRTYGAMGSELLLKSAMARAIEAMSMLPAHPKLLHLRGKPWAEELRRIAADLWVLDF